jgi:hypothetical protein
MILLKIQFDVSGRCGRCLREFLCGFHRIFPEHPAPPSTLENSNFFLHNEKQFLQWNEKSLIFSLGQQEGGNF